ncbi:hypothetical protein B7463_g5637, partial [Scytalidium lignicola]
MIQLEREADVLRRRLGMNSQSPSILTSSTGVDPAYIAAAIPPGLDTVQNETTPTRTNEDLFTSRRTASPVTPLLPSNDPTTAQTLEDILIKPETISDIFQLISPKIIDLALSSVKSKRNTILDIKALLLVLSWRFTSASLTMDIAHRLSGTMLHMSMQMSLHQPIASQEFLKCKLRNNDIDIRERAKVWSYCVIVYQRSCNSMGHPPLPMNTATYGLEQGVISSQQISSSLRFQGKLNGIITTCCTALLENGLQVLSTDQERALGILIRVFEAQLKELEPEAST